jgi:hypothetical protein
MNATFAVGSAVVETARIPLRAAEHLPGIGYLSFEGAAVKARLRSRLEGLLDDLLAAPEIERAIDRTLSGAIRRTLANEHVVVEQRIASPADDSARRDEHAAREPEPV